MSTPQTTIKICSGVRLDNSYRHSIYFDSLLDQKSYFESKVSWTFAGYSYCRKNWSIKLNATIAKARTWSYLFFDNPEDLKTYFYFITNVQYINEETVELFLELDVVQSYLFEMRLLPSFVERETPRSDEIGENTIEEGLDVGLYVINNTKRVDRLSDLAVMVMASVRLDADDLSNTVNGCNIGDLYSGIKIYATEALEGKIAKVLYQLSEEGKLDAILNIWCYPRDLVGTISSPYDPQNEYAQIFKQVTYSSTFQINDIPDLESLDGYVPKNNKLWTYPYNYLQASNNMGGSADYRYERFDGEPWFDVHGSIFPDGAVKLIPRKYNGSVGNNHEEALTVSGFPTCAWTGDTYKIWLAQNQNQQNVQALTSFGTVGAGLGMAVAGAVTANPILMGSGATMAGHGLNSIAGQIAQREDMKTYPPQARGSQNASVNAVNSNLTFTFYQKSVSAERARIIDDFFTMYGYKIQTVKTPSIHNRSLFTYTKTIGCTVAGEFCNEDKNKISSIFDNGVTFWTNGDLIGEYGEENGFLD